MAAESANENEFGSEDGSFEWETAELPELEDAEPATLENGDTEEISDIEEVDVASSDTPRGRSFTKWRKRRPFGAGLCMILGGIVILTPAYLTFNVQGLLISISSISGVSTLLIGALLIVCGILTWRAGDARFLTGVAALVLAIVALPTSNFGGFILGTVLALVGGSLAVSWSPEEKPVKTKRARKTADALVAVFALLGVTSFLVQVPNQQAEAAPEPFQIPGLPEGIVPQLPVPNTPAPNLPPAGGLPAPNEIVPGLPQPPAQAADIGGLKLGPAPEPRPGELAVSGTMEIITANTARLLGNVHLSETEVTTPSGEVVQAIRIDSDRVELDNLGLQANGVSIGMSTGPGTMSTLIGHFHIIVRSLTATPGIEAGGVAPITIDARNIDDALLKALAPTALGVPDAITDELVLRNVSLETFIVRSDELILPPSALVG